MNSKTQKDQIMLNSEDVPPRQRVGSGIPGWLSQQRCEFELCVGFGDYLKMKSLKKKKEWFSNPRDQI